MDNGTMPAIGDRVAWQLWDGRTMAGTIVDRAIGARNAMVKRVDGSVVSVAYARMRQASADDIISATEVFQSARHNAGFDPRSAPISGQF